MTRPTYVYVVWGPLYLELEVTPPVVHQQTETAFECFSGRVLRTLRLHYPGAFFQSHTVKPRGGHLHPHSWRLNMDQSGHGHAAADFTSHLGPQCFRFCAGIPQLLQRL